MIRCGNAVMASNATPPVRDAIEHIELAAVQLPPSVGTSKTSHEQKRSEITPQVTSEPVQARSTLRTVTIMIALFVSVQINITPARLLYFSLACSVLKPPG